MAAAHSASHDPRVTHDSEEEEFRERVAEESPDGRPAAPIMGGKGMIVLFGIALGVVTLVGIALGLSGYPWVAIGVVGIGVAMVIFANPVFWAGILRAKEREEIRHEEEDIRARGGKPSA